MEQEDGLIYFRDGVVVAESGDAKVYKMGRELFLEIGPSHTLWAMESELETYMWQLQDFPFGTCLEIGLGLGVASRYLLTFPKVKTLTTIEVNQDVINVHEKIKESDRGLNLEYDKSKHTIRCADGLEYAYQTKKGYDFIFLDFYDRIDEETIPAIADMAQACSRVLNTGGRMLGWLDKHTPENNAKIFFDIFNSYS